MTKQIKQSIEFHKKIAAMEKAIITTNVPGCKEIVKHMETGLLVNVNNPLQIKESIITSI